MAELLLVAGNRDKGLALLRTEVMNNPDDVRTVDAVQAIFRKAGLADEGSNLVETSRKEAGELMNAGILLARDGNYTDAIERMRAALERMPRNVRLLLNAAHIMLSYMERDGSQAALLRETKRNLLAANQLSPSEPRFVELMQRLEALQGR